ncbi:hypothetical protein Cme02nite_28290 [Catellatospora methionotrophica]|uniref:Uncharacterized protein n=1 Tax=Catellatospora methionotrophica TaxID=121620 RepID=A0A8J3L8W5_9ACTN|nr:hypothetical protein [Catellatospora methionotrophica]GIG14497.1 hypothetical protein Cme02nite_28290 [Catellatospora methionotrophica]
MTMSRRIVPFAALSVLLALTLPGTPVAAGPPEFVPAAPQNPATAPAGGASTHGDSASAKTFAQPGPAGAPVTVTRATLLAACPTLLHGGDGQLLALCTDVLGQNPAVHLLDRATGNSLARLTIAKGNLLGGVYAYLDDTDRVVVVDGNRDLLRIEHRRGLFGIWTLRVAEKTSLAAAVAADDSVVGVLAGYDRRVWFITAAGTVGVYDPATGAVSAYRLPAGERIANSLSTVPGGVAVTSDHALYLFDAGAAGTPALRWRHAYDRGPTRKPGQLSWGSGATPVFFGPASGTEYVVITDNAAPHSNLLVLRAADGGLVCSRPLFTGRAASGTENAPVAAGRSVFLTNTYGYNYPALPPDAGPSVPDDADFTGGLVRVDVRADGTGCDQVWETTTRSAALPRLSTADGKLYTAVQEGLLGELDPYYFAAVDARTGAVSDQALLGSVLVNPIQTAGTALNRVYYQGTVTGVLRIARS